MIKNVLTFISCVALLASCDYIDDPIQSSSGGGGGGNDSVVMRNILIDDFTGQRCVNCPEAAEQIHTLQNNAQFEGRVFAMAIHAGYFADPAPPVFPADYTTPDGEDFEALFGPSAFPIGMVNRVDYPNSHLKVYADWPSVAATFLNEKAIVSLDPSCSYNETDSIASIEVNIKWLKDLNSTSYNIVAAVLEDGIVGAQLTHNNPAIDTAYVFDHMLRTCTNSINGEAIGSSSITSGDEESYTTSVKIDKAWKVDQCQILVYVYDVATQEVMQVNQTSVK